MNTRPVHINRFYVFDRDDTLLDKNNHIINSQFIKEFITTVTNTPNVQWSIVSRGSMGDVSYDEAYKAIKKLNPKVEHKPPFYPVITSLNSLLSCVVSIKGLNNQEVDVIAARNSFQELFYLDYKTIQEKRSIDLANTEWTLKIGNTMIVFAAAQFDEEHQRLLVEGDYKLFGLLSALDMAGLKVNITDELKSFGIIDIKTPEHYQQIASKSVIFIDDKIINCKLINDAGFTAIHADTPALQEKIDKRSNEQYKGTINTYQAKLNESLFHVSNDMQYYVNQLRSGNIFAFLDNAKYISEKYSYLGKISPEMFIYLYMHEIAQTNIDEKDLKKLSDFYLLLGDLESQSHFLQAIGSSYAIKQIQNYLETVLIHKSFNRNIFNEIKNLSLNDTDDLKKLEALLQKNITEKGQIESIRNKNNIPRSKDTEKYKSGKDYQNFVSEHTVKTLTLLLDINQNLLTQNKYEKDKSILQQMIYNYDTRLSSQSLFSFFSTPEPLLKLENRQLAVNNLFTLYTFTKLVCKNIKNTKGLDFLRTIEDRLNIEKSGLAKEPASQRQLNGWRNDMIQVLLDVSDNNTKEHVIDLNNLYLESNAFTNELSNLIAHYNATWNVKNENASERKSSDRSI